MQKNFFVLLTLTLSLSNVMSDDKSSSFTMEDLPSPEPYRAYPPRRGSIGGGIGAGGGSYRNDMKLYNMMKEYKSGNVSLSLLD